MHGDTVSAGRPPSPIAGPDPEEGGIRPPETRPLPLLQGSVADRSRGRPCPRSRWPGPGYSQPIPAAGSDPYGRAREGQAIRHSSRIDACDPPPVLFDNDSSADGAKASTRGVALHHGAPDAEAARIDESCERSRRLTHLIIQRRFLVKSDRGLIRTGNALQASGSHRSRSATGPAYAQPCSGRPRT